MLSDECHTELENHGYQRYISVATCSACAKTPEEMRESKVHALRPLYDAAYRKSLRPSSDPEIKRLSFKLHNSSRCCGQPMAYIVGDYHDVLYRCWQERDKGLTEDMIYGPPRDGIPSIAFRFGKNGTRVEKDFLLLQNRLSIGDGRVRDLVRIFREEDVRQEAAKAAAEALAAEPVKPKPRKKRATKTTKAS